MGVPGLWEILRPAAAIRSLTEISVVEGFQANPDGVRGYRIGIDASIWFFHAEYGKEGENPVLRTLFFRCATLMHSPFLPLFVFDGPKRPDVKRGKKINKTPHKLIPGMKQIIEAFGFEWRMAPAEAEAELAYLNRIGIIDGVLSDDVDNFLFGAVTVIRNPSNNLSGNRANPNLNSAGKDDKNHTRVYRLQDITDHPEICLTRGGLILIGLFSGGDYQQQGLGRFGIITAHGLAKCGFGDTLLTAATNLSQERLEEFLQTWRQEVRQELKTNAQGHLGRKSPSLAKSIPEDFPDIDVLLSYVKPITSESMGRANKNLELTWLREPDLGKLAATCELYFEWGYREAIIKRFRTVIWHSIILRKLRRAVLDGENVNPRGIRSPTPDLTQADETSDHEGQPPSTQPRDASILVKIHSSRTHTYTDGILEYRVEIAPSQLVAIAESGLRGLRVPEGPDEWASESEEESGAKGAAKTPVNPASHLRVWMPACMMELAEPRLVKDFKDLVLEKKAKKTKKGRSTTTKKNSSKTLPKAKEPDTEVDGTSSPELEAIQPLQPKNVDPPPKKTAVESGLAGDNIKSYFTHKKSNVLSVIDAMSTKSAKNHSPTSKKAVEIKAPKRPLPAPFPLSFSGDSNDDCVSKSPRNSTVHTSPHKKRADVNLTRSISPSPGSNAGSMPPLITNRPLSQEIIEISSDSETDDAQSPPPLSLPKSFRKKTPPNISGTSKLGTKENISVEVIDLT